MNDIQIVEAANTDDYAIGRAMFEEYALRSSTGCR
jgi:hypothetical protein